MEQQRKEEKTNRKSPRIKAPPRKCRKSPEGGGDLGRRRAGWGNSGGTVSRPAGEGKALAGDGSGRKTQRKKAAETPKLTQVVHTPSLILALQLRPHPVTASGQ